MFKFLPGYKRFQCSRSPHIDLLIATFIYGLPTIAGAATMLPGGLGATDASITGLLVILAIPKSVSVAATLIHQGSYTLVCSYCWYYCSYDLSKGFT